MEELMRDAQGAAEPGEPSGTVVEGFKKDGAAAVLDSVSAGHVRVWNILTGEPSIVNRNMLEAQLKKTDALGGWAFTTDFSKVKGVPVVGTLKCLLHAEHPDRAMHKALGFRVCPKSNLLTALDVRTHMQHRHRREWESLQEAKKTQIEAEERQVRMAVIDRTQRFDLQQKAKEAKGERFDRISTEKKD